MIKYSKQREMIYNQLANRYDHPTAETIYLELKEDNPALSLGTVYRNLSLLAELGRIIKISTENGPDRFDYNTSPHYHFSCERCGGLLDIEIEGQEDMQEKLNAKAGAVFPGIIKRNTIQFFGICPECKDKE